MFSPLSVAFAPLNSTAPANELFPFSVIPAPVNSAVANAVPDSVSPAMTAPSPLKSTLSPFALNVPNVTFPLNSIVGFGVMSLSDVFAPTRVPSVPRYAPPNVSAVVSFESAGTVIVPEFVTSPLNSIAPLPQVNVPLFETSPPTVTAPALAMNIPLFVSAPVTVTVCVSVSSEPAESVAPLPIVTEDADVSPPRVNEPADTVTSPDTRLPLVNAVPFKIVTAPAESSPVVPASVTRPLVLTAEPL